MRSVLFFLLSLFFWLSLSWHIPPAKATETFSPIILSEIQIDGKDSAGKTVGEDEFIELYNPTAQPVTLAGLKLCRKTSGTTTSQIKSFTSGDTIAKESYFLFANSEGIFSALADAKTKSSPLAKNNSVALADDCTAPTIILDSIAWGSGKKFNNTTALRDNPASGNSLSRDLTNLLWTESNAPSPKSSSPNIPPPPDPVPDPTPPANPIPSKSASVRINEIFPNPETKGDSGEFIELYNFGSEKADISGWLLRDATQSGKYIFPSGTSISASGYFVVTDQSFTISLNNTNETLSLFNQTGLLIDTAHYEKTKEDVSLNFTPVGWRGGTPTPGLPNLINNLPETHKKVPKKSFKHTPTIFDATSKDEDGDTLKHTWDFGDGHKSYKKKTTHRYEKNGTYTVTLTTNDGKEDSVETFRLKIESYDTPKIRITALSPNPRGKDNDNEWMLIENREKKTVNLKDFSIATGWKKLTNHPVREDFFIPPKQEVRLTRADLLFTLPNQKGRIELRAPDGKVLQKIKYRLEKSLAEDTLYKKEKGKQWTWEESASTITQKTSTEKNNTGTNQEPILPEAPVLAEPVTLSTRETAEPVTPVATASRAINSDQQLKAFLSTGTRVLIPDAVRLNIDVPTQKDSSFILPEEHYAVSFSKTALLKINTELNALINILQ